MSKKIWIPILGVLLAVAILLSPLSPVALSPSSPGATKSTAEIPLSIGEILDPSGNPFAHTFSDTKDIRATTYVVAASDSEHKYMADYRCDGTNDHIEIQVALDALSATGGEVLLLDGEYNIEASLVLDSYQTLRGCGKNTILTTTTAGLDIITATGGDGSEEVGILIADLCVDGNLGGVVNDSGILWTYVDHSKIMSVWSQNNGDAGIWFTNCDFNVVSANMLLNNTYGIAVIIGEDNAIIGNICYKSGTDGINFYDGNNNVVLGNICRESGYAGIYLDTSNNNSISQNICQRNDRAGIYLSGPCDNNNISSNICLENGQAALDNSYDNIYLEDSDYNLIANNICRAPTIGTTLTVGEPIAETEIAVTDTAGFEVGMGVVIDLGGGNEEYHRISAIAAGAPGVITIDAGLANVQGAGETIDVPEARYGINISDDICDKNIVQGNDLHDAGKTANFNDAGTCTIVQDDNREINQTQVKHMVYMKNTSDGNLVVGDVVSLNAIAAGTEFTTPAAVGEDQVWGMLAEDINDDAWGYVQVKGGTVLLKATNAVAGNIAIGDFLCTEAAGTRAQKAGAADMAFAIALEVCEAADVTIDALLIVPRKI